MLKVFNQCCKNCLLSKDSIVSPNRRKEIITGCVKDQSYFVCHKATQEGKDIVCRTYFDKLGQHSQMIRIAERLGMIEFVEQQEHEKLITHSEMSKK